MTSKGAPFPFSRILLMFIHPVIIQFHVNHFISILIKKMITTSVFLNHNGCNNGFQAHYIMSSISATFDTNNWASGPWITLRRCRCHAVPNDSNNNLMVIVGAPFYSHHTLNITSIIPKLPWSPYYLMPRTWNWCWI